MSQELVALASITVKLVKLQPNVFYVLQISSFISKIVLVKLLVILRLAFYRQHLMESQHVLLA